MQRTRAILAAALAALAVVAFAVLTVGYGLPPVEAGAVVAGVAALGFVEVVLDRSSI